jgi:peptide/nickel transport system substrate-binding protein
MKGFIRILASLAATVALLVIQPAVAPRFATASTASAVSRYGGTVQVRLSATPDCLDDTKAANNADNQIAEAWIDPLITLDQHGKPSPDLALSWKVSPGGRAYTFFLRHGVRFSDGNPLTASAVKWTFERILRPSTKSQNAGLLGPVSTIKVLNPYTVQIILKSSFRPLLTGLASNYLGVLDPKAKGNQLANSCTSPVGSGAFKITNVGPGYSSVTLVRNPYHTWGTGWANNQGRAYLNKLVFQTVLSDSTAVSELLTGSLDVSDVAGSQLSRVPHTRAFVLHRRLTEGATFLEFNTSHTPLDDPNMRLGISEAIDRTSLVKAALNGQGKPAYSSISPSIPGYDKQSPSLAPHYNPADAQRLLGAHKITGSLTLLTFNIPVYQVAAEAIQAELGQVGVQTQIKPLGVGDYISAAGKGQYDLAVLGYSYPDPDIMYLLFHSSQGNGAGLNFTFYKSDTLDSLLNRARTVTNLKKALSLYVQAQRFMARITLIDPLYTGVGVLATRSRVQGYHENLFTSGYTVVPIWQDMWVTTK